MKPSCNCAREKHKKRIDPDFHEVFDNSRVSIYGTEPDEISQCIKIYWIDDDELMQTGESVWVSLSNRFCPECGLPYKEEE